MSNKDMSHGQMPTMQGRKAKARNLFGGLIGILLLLSLVHVAPSLLWAQGEALNARLTGVVTDPAGAAVPGATLILVNTQTQATRTFATTNQGDYTLTFLPAGTYQLKVEKAGFKTTEQSNIVLTVGQAATLNVKLDLGQVTEVVQVTESAATLNTTNANIGSEVNHREVVELPINNRNVFTLESLDSSVNHMAGASEGYDSGDQTASFFSFSGRRPGTVAYLLDGHWDGAPSWDAVMFEPTVDETQEFKIQSYSFSAQYGWNQGNVLNAITKSGTDRFHGDVYEFIRNSALDANNFFNVKNGLGKTPFKRNQFGATIGGPLVIPGLLHKGKTFIFGSYEGLRLQNPVTDIDTVPSAAMKGGDFSSLLGGNIGTDSLGRPVLSGQIYDPFSTRQVTAGQVDPTTGLTASATGHVRDPFPGNIIPVSRFDQVAKGMLQYWPDPNRPGDSSNFVVAQGIPATTNRYTVRVDHTISDKSHVFARWSQAKIFLGSSAPDFGPNNAAGPGSSQKLNSFDMGAQYVHTFSSTLVLSVSGGWTRWYQGFIPQGYGFKPSTLGLPSFLDQQPNFPSIGIDGEFGLGAGGGESATPAETRSLFADLTKVHGAHTFGIGYQSVFFPQYETFINPASYNFDRGMTSGPDPVTTGPQTGFGFASYVLGTGSNGDYNIPAQSSLFKKFFGWYFQDDWKISRKLTLNLGVRYDFQTAPTERYDRITQFEPNAPNPVLSQDVGFSVPGFLQYVGGSVGRGAYKTDYTNLAPRLGMAYSITNKLVLRAGFGMFYSPAIQMSAYQGLTLFGFSSDTPWVATVDGITPHDLLSDPFPNGFIQPVGKADGVMTQVGQNVNANIPQQLGKSYRPTPYMRQWMLDFQYAFSPSDTLSVAYVGNSGVDLNFKRYEADQLTASNQALGSALLDPVPNPFYGIVASGSPCGLDQPTITLGQSLRPWPQYCSVVNRQPSGAISNYDGLMVNYRHDWKQGLHFTGSFTYSKWLSNSTGNEQGTVPGNFWQQNIYNLRGDYSYDTDDIPKSLVLSYIYELPVGRGKSALNNANRFVNGILGGWQVSGVSSFKDGFPMAIANVNNNSGALGGFNAQRPNIVGNPRISNPNPEEWFNTAAFAQPAPYTFGAAPRTIGSIRNMGTNNWDFSAQKWFGAFDEKLRFQFRAELYNAFNRVYLTRVDQSFGSSTFGQAYEAAPGRSIQFALKIYY
jgi:hypothetical protein